MATRVGGDGVEPLLSITCDTLGQRCCVLSMELPERRVWVQSQGVQNGVSGVTCLGGSRGPRHPGIRQIDPCQPGCFEMGSSVTFPAQPQQCTLDAAQFLDRTMEYQNVPGLGVGIDRR